MEIRRYVPGEEEAIWHVFFRTTHESNARDYHPDLIEGWAARDRDMDEWRTRIEEKNPFVAVMAGEIVGFAELEAGGFIDCFYVHPEWQGKGVGKALFRRVEAEALGAGETESTADVSVTARTFFEALGFDIVEARSKVIDGHLAPNFSMKKQLGAG